MGIARLPSTPCRGNLALVFFFSSPTALAFSHTLPRQFSITFKHRFIAYTLDAISDHQEERDRGGMQERDDRAKTEPPAFPETSQLHQYTTFLHIFLHSMKELHLAGYLPPTEERRDHKEDR
jgi:hypothetical protein